MSEQAPLLRICSLLNQHKTRYLIIGARACSLHGYVRATTDVDILVPEDWENHERLIAALSELVPYIDLATLIATKRTKRDQDQVDVQRLRSLIEERKS